jgi:hypothetical protein
MKSLFKTSAFLIYCLCLFSKQLLANHAAGGTLTYAAVVGNQYIIRASFYRDCSGDPTPQSFTVYISSVQCGITDSVILTHAFVDLEVPHICPTTTTCIGGTEPGFQKCDFEGMYTFPAQCQDWLMSINFGNRRSALTTIQNPSSTNLYVETRLNNQNGNNYSPQFSIDPVMVACIGKSRIFNPGAVDADGDSLVYELIPARSDANTNVVYNVSYSALQPLTSSPAMTLDPVTGDLFMFPQALEVGVAVYRILEYRSGVLVGSVTYDMDLYTIPCPNSSPYTTGVNGTMDFTYYVLPGYFCFDIFSNDIDTADVVTMVFNTSGIPTSTYSVNGTPHPTGTFCWTPDSADVSTQPYTFSVILGDNGCPLRNVQVDTFYIIVTLDSSLVTQTDDVIFSAEDDKIQVIPNPISQNAEIILSESFKDIESRFSIVDMVGRKVISNFLKTSSIIIKAEDFKSGIYFFELVNINGRSATGKFIIQ